LTEAPTNDGAADPLFREIVDGDPDRGVVVFDALLRPVFASSLVRSRAPDATSSLRPLVANARDRADAAPAADLMLEVVGERAWRVSITPVRRESTRWFVVRLNPSASGGDPTIRRLQTRFRLTLRESEVALAVAKGLSNGETARSLGITEKTVKNALVAIYAKCGVRNRVELALRVHDAPVTSHDDLHPTVNDR
jgi:DNA-binding CsgD family transcriptional regulator